MSKLIWQGQVYDKYFRILRSDKEWIVSIWDVGLTSETPDGVYQIPIETPDNEVIAAATKIHNEK